MNLFVLEPRRFCVIAICLAAVASLTACGRTPKSNSVSAPSTSQPNQPPPPPKPTATTSGYANLASNLADSFLTDRNQQPLKKELAQLLAEANIKIVRYQSITTTDPMIRRISQEAADSGTEMVKSQQTLDTLNQDDGFTGFLIGALGLYLGEPTAIISGAGQILAKGDAKQQERIKWGAAFNRSRAAQLMLPEAAKEYAGSPASGQLLSIDFDESFAGSANHDVICLTNASGKSLTNCTVLVELRGKDGDVRQNVHFVPNWSSGVSKFARYGIGVEADSGVYGRRTVYGVQELHVSVWADEGKQEDVVYRYVGAERDKDVRAQLDGKMKVMYHYDASPWFSSTPEVDLSLTGVPMIPAHTVTLTFTGKTKTGGDAKPVSLSWDQEEWLQNRNRTFDLGHDLTFAPEGMEIKVTFDQVGYVYTRSISLLQK